MKKTFVMTAAWLGLVVGPAAGSGLNLGWSDCAGLGGGAVNRTFACDTNSGDHVLVGSFLAPAGLVRVTGFEAALTLQTAGATLASWWDIGGCRSSSAATFSADFTTGPFSCTDYFTGGASGGGYYLPLEGGPNRAEMRIGFALPLGSSGIGAIATDNEVYAFKVTINNSKTTGLGACTGCSSGACIVFNRLLVTNEPGTPEGDFVIANVAQCNHVVWQGGDLIACQQITPVQNASWGRIKTLYR